MAVKLIKTFKKKQQNQQC